MKEKRRILSSEKNNKKQKQKTNKQTKNKTKQKNEGVQSLTFANRIKTISS